MDFYERVKTLAKASKLSIENVANKAGLTLDSYNSYKRHSNLPRADEAVKIAQALNTSVEYLVTGKDSNIYKEKYDVLVTAIKELPVS